MGCRLKTRVIFLPIILFAFIVSCDKQKPDGFLKIENHWFSTTEFFSRTQRHTFQYLPEVEQSKIINDFIDRQYLVYFAFENNYHRIPDVRDKIRKLKNKLLINEYFDRMVLDSIITKQRLLHEYERLDPGKRDLFTYDEYKSELRSKLTKELSEEIREKYYRTIEFIKKDNRFIMNPANIDTLSKQYMDILISHRGDSVSHTAVDYLKMTGYNRPLCQINGKNIYLSDFISDLTDFPFILPNQYSDPELLYNIIETVTINNLVLDLARKARLYKSPDFKQRFEIQKNNVLYQAVFSKNISKTIEINDDTLLNFYSENLDSLYLTKPRYEVQEIFITDKTTAEKVLKRALNNEDFQKLADTYTERYQNKPVKGYLGFIFSDTYAGIGLCASRTLPGNVYPELVPSGKGYSIVRVLSIEEAAPIPFKKVKGRVLDDCKKTKISERKAELLRSLKHKYSYYVDHSALFN